MNTKYILGFIRIAIIRGFLPVNILMITLAMKLYDKHEWIVTFGYFVAVAQLTACLDFGAAAKLLSTKSIGSDFRIVFFYKKYMKSLFLYKFFVFSILLLFLWLLRVVDEFLLYTTVMGWVCGEFLVVYGLVLNNALSENENFLVLRFYSLILFGQISMFSSLVFFNGIDSISEWWVLTSYLFGFVLASLILICVDGGSYSPAKHDSKLYTMRLQVSQICSSIISNKEYILLYFFLVGGVAGEFSTLARFFQIPSQILTLLISKMWVDIANNGVCEEDYYRHRKTVILFSITMCGGAVFVGFLFFGITSLVYLLPLYGQVVMNSYSAVTSSYANVSGNIPPVEWYAIAVLCTFFLSSLCYVLGVWWLSILVTCVFYYLLGRKNIMGVFDS